MNSIEYLQSAPLVIPVTRSRVFKVELAPGGRFPRSPANHAVNRAFLLPPPKAWPHRHLCRSEVLRETLPSETRVMGRTGKNTPPLDETWRGKGHQQ